MVMKLALGLEWWRSSNVQLVKVGCKSINPVFALLGQI